MCRVQEEYEITDKVGRGRYADVYAGVHMLTGQEVAIKILKPIKKNKIRREVKILNLLKGCSYITEIKDVVRDASTKTPAIITEFVNQGDTDIKKIWKNFTLSDIQNYMLSTLKALEYAHSRGVMHRDIKPHNILVDQDDKSIKLADWGLAEFYKSETEYNTKVAALFYKAPELMLGYPYYDYSIDIWALG
jgi:casein kinase II subunit alpha